MPIYEFKCGNCGCRMEKLCPVGENGENLKCPQCGTQGPTRIMSSFSSTGISSGGGTSSCSSCSSGNCSSCSH